MDAREGARPSSSTASASFEAPTFAMAKMRETSPVPLPLLPFTRDSVLRLLALLAPPEEEQLCALLTTIHAALYPLSAAAPEPSHNVIKEALADLQSPRPAWKRICPKILVSLTFLCCELLFTLPPYHQKPLPPVLKVSLSNKAICGSTGCKPAILSHLLGYSLIYGWAPCLFNSAKLSSADAHEKLDHLIATVLQSPVLKQIHAAPLWALCYHGELLMGQDRLHEAMGYFQVVRACMQSQIYADRQEKFCMDILYERVCWLLLNCMDTTELQGTNGGLFAASDVTLVVDILAIAIKNGVLKHAHNEFGLACSRGSVDQGHFDHMRAQEIVNYFQRTPRLRNTTMHLLILCRYADLLREEGEDDKSRDLLMRVIKVASTNPALQEVKMLALMRLPDTHSAQLLPFFDNMPIKHEIQRAGFYLNSKKPQEAFQSAMKVLHAASRGDPTIGPLHGILLVMASASAMMNDYSGALILIEQARYACQKVDGSLVMINNEWTSYLYVTGQQRQARALNEETLQLAAKLGHTSPEYRGALHLRAQLYYTFQRQNSVFMQMDFELSQSAAFDIGYKTALSHEIASSTLYKGLIKGRLVPDSPIDNGERVPDIEAVEHRYSSLKQQNNVNLIDLFREGVVLCTIYIMKGHMHEGVARELNDHREVFLNKGRAMIKELYDHLMNYACSFQYMQHDTMEMAVHLAGLGVLCRLPSPTFDLLAAVLKHVIPTLFSLANSSDITSAVECSNFYKVVYLLILKVCCFTFDDAAAFVWSQRCKGMALSAHLFSVYKNSPALDDYEDFMYSDSGRLESVARCLRGCRMIVIDYTIFPPDLMLISLIALTPEGVYAERHLQWVSLRFLDEDTQRMARQEFWHLSSKLFENHPLGSHEDQVPVTPVPTSFVPPRLVAENAVRGGISSQLCQGLVAITQRLAAEIERALQRRDRRRAQELAREMQEYFASLYDMLIKPIGDKLDRLLESDLYDVLLIAPDEDLWLLPFSALYNRDSGKYLIEEIPIVMAPSIRVAGFCKDVYEQMSPAEQIPPELIMGRTAGYPEGWPELTCAEKEMQAVKSCFSSQGHYLHFQDDYQDAKSTVLLLMKNASWIHFTFHGEVTENFPRGSLILGRNDEERLDAKDIVACRPLSARAVVLSACETGLGAIRGEGILGLVRAFIQAGVPLVIASLWKVADQYTAEYMERLYQILQEDKLCVPRAMQQVALERMEANLSFKETEVLKWSAFTCVGYPYVTLPMIDSS